MTTSVEIYLGTIIDAKLTFDSNTAVINRKCYKKLHLSRKLSSLDIGIHVFQIFYKNNIERSVIFDFFVMYGGGSVVHRNTLARTDRISSKVEGKQQTMLHYLHKQ